MLELNSFKLIQVVLMTDLVGKLEPGGTQYRPEYIMIRTMGTERYPNFWETANSLGCFDCLQDDRQNEAGRGAASQDEPMLEPKNGIRSTKALWGVPKIRGTFLGVP